MKHSEEPKAVGWETDLPRVLGPPGTYQQLRRASIVLRNYGLAMA